MSNLSKILVVIAVALSAACSASQVEQAQLSREAAQRLVSDELGAAHRRAESAQIAEMQNDLHTVVGRYNPGRCECPKFEVLLADVWTRVYLRWVEAAPAADTRIEALEETAAEALADGTHPLYILTARLTGERLTAANDLEYRVMVVSKVDDIGPRSRSSAIKISATGVPEVRLKPSEAPLESPPDAPVDPDTPREPDAVPDASEDNSE